MHSQASHNISSLLEALTLMGGKPLQSHIDHVTSLDTGGQHSQWRDADSHALSADRGSRPPLHGHLKETARRLGRGSPVEL